MQKCLVWDKYPHIWCENSECDSGMTVKENHRKSCFFLLILSVKEKGKRTLSNNRGFINYGKFMAKLLYSHSKWCGIIFDDLENVWDVSEKSYLQSIFISGGKDTQKKGSEKVWEALSVVYLWFPKFYNKHIFEINTQTHTQIFIDYYINSVKMFCFSFHNNIKSIYSTSTITQ